MSAEFDKVNRQLRDNLKDIENSVHQIQRQANAGLYSFLFFLFYQFH